MTALLDGEKARALTGDFYSRENLASASFYD